MTAVPESADASESGAGASNGAAGSAAAPTDHDERAEATVQVSTTFPYPVDKVWQTLITREGAEALLGAGAALGGKGEPWRSGDGPHGVLRSYHPLEQLRLSWHADDYAPASLVDLQLRPEGTGTRVELKHEHVPVDDAAKLQQHWSEALDRVGSATG